MCEISRYLKARHPGCVVVFIGPCVAKKSEIIDQQIRGNADYAMICSEIEAVMRAKGVKLEPVEDEYQESSVYGKKYATSGGVSGSCLEYLKKRLARTATSRLQESAEARNVRRRCFSRREENSRKTLLRACAAREDASTDRAAGTTALKRFIRVRRSWIRPTAALSSRISRSSTFPDSLVTESSRCMIRWRLKLRMMSRFRSNLQIAVHIY